MGSSCRNLPVGQGCGVGGHLWVWWLSEGSSPKVCWSLEWAGDGAEASTSLAHLWLGILQ